VGLFRKLVMTAIVLAGVTACGLGRSQAPTKAGPIAAQAGTGGVTVRLRLSVPTYRAQTVVPRYTRSEIDHVLLRVFGLKRGAEAGAWREDAIPDAAGNPLKASVPRASLDQDISFSGLQGGLNLRFRAEAYKGPDEQPNNLISTPDSYMDYGLAHEHGTPEPPFPVLTVVLQPSAFSASSTGSAILVEPGQRISWDLPDISAPEVVPTDPPGTVLIEPLTEEAANQEWQWGDEEYGDE